jgi:short-chain fatty acids transporter
MVLSRRLDPTRPADPFLTRAVNAVARWSARWVPNAFVIACLLTLVTFALVVGVAGKNPIAAQGYWTKGFWELLELTMQLSLIVLTGYIVAVSPIVSRGLELLAGVASTNRGAVVLMGLVSMAASWLHWGLGLIAGPIFLGFLVRRHPRIDYRLAVAASYLGSTCTWHAGLSGSAPLIMATPKNFMEAQAGLVPVSTTTFSWFNLTLTAMVNAKSVDTDKVRVALEGISFSAVSPLSASPTILKPDTLSKSWRRPLRKIGWSSDWLA